jgi:hypothetical protein
MNEKVSSCLDQKRGARQLKETRNLLLAYESPLAGEPRTVRVLARGLKK